MRRRWILLAGLLALSCATQKQAAEVPPALRDRQAEEIIALDRQIQDFRVDMGLPPKPDRRYWREPEGTWSTPAVTEECKDVCNLAEHICENADKICEIAGEMPGDTWAKSKCDSAKASCNEARDRCEKCGK